MFSLLLYRPSLQSAPVKVSSMLTFAQGQHCGGALWVGDSVCDGPGGAHIVHWAVSTGGVLCTVRTYPRQ